MQRVLIRGNGIAGLTAARRFALAGYSVHLVGRVHPSDLTITLDEGVVKLLRMEFGERLLSTLDTLQTERIFRVWESAAIETFQQSLRVYRLSDLITAIARTMPAGVTRSHVSEVDDGQFDFRVDASGRPPKPLLKSGERSAHVWHTPNHIELMGPVICANENDGWLFACPGPSNKVSIQMITPHSLDQCTPEAVIESLVSLLSETPAGVDSLVEHINGSARSRDASPCFTLPVSEVGELRIGDAVASGDPISGDGVGRAIRGAVLATAVLLEDKSKRQQALAHFASRLASAHRAHLEACASYYNAARCRKVFRVQIAKMREDAITLSKVAQDQMPLRLLA